MAGSQVSLPHKSNYKDNEQKTKTENLKKSRVSEGSPMGGTDGVYRGKDLWKSCVFKLCSSHMCHK